MSLLQIAVPPRLPNAPLEYEKRFHDQHSDVLRLYFSQLSNALRALTGPRGGLHLNFPYAAIQRTTDQTFTANTATLITFDQNDYLNGCSNPGGDGVTLDRNSTGLYNYQFSVQFKNTDTQIHSAWVWLRRSGVTDEDVPGTGSKFDVPASHGGVPGRTIGACNFFVALDGEDIIEMYAAVSDTHVTFEALPAQTVPFAMPAVPSVVATLSFVSLELP